MTNIEATINDLMQLDGKAEAVTAAVAVNGLNGDTMDADVPDEKSLYSFKHSSDDDDDDEAEYDKAPVKKKHKSHRVPDTIDQEASVSGDDNGDENSDNDLSDEEVDDGFVVPDGHLSQDEIDNIAALSAEEREERKDEKVRSRKKATTSVKSKHTSEDEGSDKEEEDRKNKKKKTTTTTTTKKKNRLRKIPSTTTTTTHVSAPLDPMSHVLSTDYQVAANYNQKHKELLQQQSSPRPSIKPKSKPGTVVPPSLPASLSSASSLSVPKVKPIANGILASVNNVNTPSRDPVTTTSTTTASSSSSSSSLSSSTATGATRKRKHIQNDDEDTEEQEMKKGDKFTYTGDTVKIEYTVTYRGEPAPYNADLKRYNPKKCLPIHQSTCSYGAEGKEPMYRLFLIGSGPREKPFPVSSAAADVILDNYEKWCKQQKSRTDKQKFNKYIAELLKEENLRMDADTGEIQMYTHPAVYKKIKESYVKADDEVEDATQLTPAEKKRRDNAHLKKVEAVYSNTAAAVIDMASDMLLNNKGVMEHWLTMQDAIWKQAFAAGGITGTSKKKKKRAPGKDPIAEAAKREADKAKHEAVVMKANELFEALHPDHPGLGTQMLSMIIAFNTLSARRIRQKIPLPASVSSSSSSPPSTPPRKKPPPPLVRTKNKLTLSPKEKEETESDDDDEDDDDD